MNSEAEDILPALPRGMKTDLVHEPLHLREFFIGRSLRRVEVDLVFGAEMLLEDPAVLRYPVKAEERFAAGDTGPEGTHVLGFFYDLRRDIHGSLVCKDRVRPFPLARERAVPAGTVTASGNEEHHLCALVAEDTAFCE